MREIHGLTQLTALVGEELGVSEWHTVTQDQVQAFADATGDQQWIHVDPVAAAAGPFGLTVAHGYLTLSMIPFLAKQVYQVAGLRMVVNYGLNKVRFPNPVPVGSRVRDRLTLLSVTGSERGHQAVIRHRIEIDAPGRPACVAETVSLLVE
ncbi:Acyl dehydratase [Cryobacterium psychrotolerans]|uniref:Acyl dehydratase n=1 Tax=Cryobacterium psychrotolerans TaxID=386301 RepID=A0A1G8YI91_9MICO|nr:MULTISPECIES: MaoC family dehydratase [Cryobacterium]TFD40888.1 MaoC family dehydratase [Cryobacterium sp. TMT1-2-1]TFD85307.1 MaoC family dehydratase [Cryobacterium psychrotolerans]SDK02367.1 Acyl dehydratase [Cryobacterium psychrotolerans]